MDIERLKNDVEKEKAGEWVDLPGFPGVQVLATSNKARAYERMHSRLIAKRRREINSVPEGTAAQTLIFQDIAMECMRRVGIRDWRGVTRGAEKVPVPYEELADTIFGTAPGMEAKERIRTREYHKDLIDAMSLAVTRVGVVDRSVEIDDDEPADPEAGDVGKGEPPK